MSKAEILTIERVSKIVGLDPASIRQLEDREQFPAMVTSDKGVRGYLALDILSYTEALGDVQDDCRF